MTDIEGLTLDGLNVNDLSSAGPHLELEAPPTFPPAKARRNLVSGADSDGAVPSGREDHYDLTEHVLKVRACDCITADQAFDLHGQIIDFFTRARRTPGGLPMVWTPGDGGGRTFTKYVIAGDITEMPLDIENGYLVGQPVFTYTLLCRPFGYGDELSFGALTGFASPLRTVQISGVPGDVAAEGRLILTDTSSLVRRHVEWGLEHDHYDPSASRPLVIDSDLFEITGFAGSQVSDSRMLSAKAVQGTPSNTATTLFAVTAQHVGVFRVRLIAEAPTRVLWRLVWGTDEGSMRANPWRSTPVDSGRCDVELGIITIPEPPDGDPRWIGRVEFMYTGAPVSAVKADLLMLLPADEGYATATSPVIYRPTSPGAHDEFATAADGSALDGRAAAAGGTWHTLTPSDFSALTVSGWRTKVMSATSTSLRVAVLGTTLTGDPLEVGADTTIGGGPCARVVDKDNLVWAGVAPDTLRPVLMLRLAGVNVSLGQLAPLPAGRWPAIKLIVYPTGSVYAFVFTYADQAATTTVFAGVMAAVHPALVAGGALEQGRAGIYYGGSSSGFCVLDNFYLSVPSAEPAVIRAGRSAEFSADGALTQSADGLRWIPTPSRGSRFFVPPGGPSRLAVRITQHDPASGAAPSVADSSTIEIRVRPRYLAFPRA